MKKWLDKYSDIPEAQIGTALKPITAENVSNFLDLLSIPQKALTKLISGKYQTPSEAMGIKNKAGAIATDIILDPVNLIGAGAVKASGAYKNAYKLNPFAQKLINPNKSYRVAGMDAFDDFIESGVVRSYTPQPQPGMSFAERMKQRPTGFPSFQKGFADLNYLPEEGGVVFETGLPTYKRGNINPVTGKRITGRHYAHRVIDPQTGKTLHSVPGDDIKVYEGKPHWLMGHKQIKTPKKKQDGGGIEGTMGGLTDKGFNYNGAWGGTMQLGGSLPGAVGMMYARTKGAAPSNGPYAKKTKASAQDGKEMQYYQQGLDFKPKNISKNGDMIQKAQPGKTLPKWKQRLEEEAAKLDSPLSTLNLGKKGYTKDEIKTIQKAAEKEQPVIQTPKGKQLSEEEIKRKNKAYAEQTGKKYNEKTGAVEDRFSPSTQKKLNRLENAILNTANYALSTPARLVQSAYKEGYTPGMALRGEPSNASLVEDLVTDPTNLVSLGMKGALKGGLSAALLPFYKAVQRPAWTQTGDVVGKLDELKSLVSSPEARQAFKRISDEFGNHPIAAAIDPAYTSALKDPNLPIKALDQYYTSMISPEPSANMLTKEQVKYLDNIGSLATDYKRIDRWNTTPKERAKFIIDNSKNISPRDIIPFIMNESRQQFGGGRSVLSDDDVRELVKDLYTRYSGQATDNPLAEYTAATDLFSLADTYTGAYSPLSNKIKSGLRELGDMSEKMRPQILINDPYFDPAKTNYDAEEAIHLLERDDYRTIPTEQERVRNMRMAGKKVIETVNDVFNNPLNKGKFYVGAHSLSTDSYPLTLNLFARNKDKLDFLPIHGGAPFQIYPTANPMSGLSNFGSARRAYLEKRKDMFDQVFNPPSLQNYGTPLAGFRQLQGQMIESAYLNHHINEFNKNVGTNMPGAYFSIDENSLVRPNIGAIIKKDGGPVVKDNDGYWNPENWGEPVEIDSNEITMQGVDQDLIGVSDTGDVQYLEANAPENYKFKGKKVTEYPVTNWLEKYK